jgi:hypothetical protein
MNNILVYIVSYIINAILCTWNVRRMKLCLWFQHNFIKPVEVGKNKETVYYTYDYLHLGSCLLCSIPKHMSSTLFCEMKLFCPEVKRWGGSC